MTLSPADAQQEALRAGVWLERPPELRLVRLTGPQRVWFLHNTVTADVENVPTGRWVDSCFLDPKGRIQAYFRVGFREDEIWLDVEGGAAGQLAEWFQRYRFRTKVEIETRPRRCITILGDAARSYAPDGEIKGVERGGLAFGHTLADVAVADVHVDDPESSDALRALPKATPELYDIFRVEAGIGTYGIDYGSRELPQEAGLTRVLSVEKGCYVGQETVARIHFRGHVNRVLRPLAFVDVVPGEAPGRQLIWEGRPAGRVTSAVHSPRRGPIGLGLVRVEPPKDARLELEGGGSAVLGAIPEGTKVKAAG